MIQLELEKCPFLLCCNLGHLDFVDFGSLYTYSLDDDYFDYDLVATTDPIIFWTESITRIYVSNKI